MERMTGVEPAFKAWEAFVLPMNYIRKKCAFWARAISLACDSRYMWQIVRIEKSDFRYMWQTLTEKHRQKA